MDDMYQYASAAVNSNSPHDTNQGTEDNDVVLQAFTNFGWGQRFNTLMDTVKKQGEALVEVTRRDFEEIAQALREDGSDDAPARDMSTSTSSTTTAAEAATTTAAAGPASPSDSMSFASLRERISTLDLNSLLPAQRLPENMDLTQLRTEVIQGTRYAEQYLQKFGSEVMDVVSKAITVLEPEDEDEHTPRTSSENQHIYATRKEALMAKMRVNPDTYMHEPEDSKVLQTFNAGFSIDEYTDEITRLLQDHSDLDSTMHELVPVKVDYPTFWRRYFYRAWCIDQDEQKRQLIVKGVHDEDDEADFKWDSDDDDENDHATASNAAANNSQQSDVKGGDEGGKSKQSTDSKGAGGGGSDTDFSNISEPVSTEPSLVSPPLKSEADGDDWVKADPKKKADNDDSDSDWE